MYTLTARNSGYHPAKLDFPPRPRNFQPAAHSTSTLGCSIGLSKGTSPPIAPPETCAPPVNCSSVLPVTQASDLSFFHTHIICQPILSMPPSKDCQNPVTSHYFHCHHPEPSHHHLSPGRHAKHPPTWRSLHFIHSLCPHSPTLNHKFSEGRCFSRFVYLYTQNLKLSLEYDRCLMNINEWMNALVPVIISYLFYQFL